METGRCPKCHEREIHVVDGNRFAPEIPTGGLSKAFICAYVCAQCGYVELYVEDKSDLPRIAERWPKLGG